MPRLLRYGRKLWFVFGWFTIRKKMSEVFRCFRHKASWKYTSKQFLLSNIALVGQMQYAVKAFPTCYQLNEIIWTILLLSTWCINRTQVYSLSKCFLLRTHSTTWTKSTPELDRSWANHILWNILSCILPCYCVSQAQDLVVVECRSVVD